MLPTRYPGDFRQVKTEAALLAQPLVMVQVPLVIKGAAEELPTAASGEMEVAALAAVGIAAPMVKMAAVAARVQ